MRVFIGGWVFDSVIAFKLPIFSFLALKIIWRYLVPVIQIRNETFRFWIKHLLHLVRIEWYSSGKTQRGRMWPERYFKILLTSPRYCWMNEREVNVTRAHGGCSVLCDWPRAPGFSRSVCVLPALFAQLGQVELGLQGHLQGASVDELQLHPKALRGTAQTGVNFGTSKN